MLIHTWYLTNDLAGIRTFFVSKIAKNITGYQVSHTSFAILAEGAARVASLLTFYVDTSYNVSQDIAETHDMRSGRQS